MSAVPSSTFQSVTDELRSAGCVFAEDEAQLLISSATTPADLAAMVARRATGVPLEHILGWAEFCGLRITVRPGVFIPRRRTELLVHEAVVIIRKNASRRPTLVVDQCCGSGAVGAALISGMRGIELYAVDIDPTAVLCARQNLMDSGQVYEGDLFEPLPDFLQGKVNVIVANAPYVPTDAIDFMPPEARLHEPRVALSGGKDGLDIQRRVITGAQQWLAADGHLLIETSERQAPATLEAFARNGFAARVVHSNELDGTVVVGRGLSA